MKQKKQLQNSMTNNNQQQPPNSKKKEISTNYTAISKEPQNLNNLNWGRYLTSKEPEKKKKKKRKDKTNK